jgi:hypothetical protein
MSETPMDWRAAERYEKGNPERDITLRVTEEE